MLALARHGVPSYFCSHTGRLVNAVAPPAADWPTWMAQARRAEDSVACLEVARSIVRAKLHNTATRAVSLKLSGSGRVAEGLRDLEQSCLDQGRVESLLGLEGRGAAVFFGALAKSLPRGWGFERRAKHPAPDPVNAMLSFAATILYNHISTALLAQGLNPRIGLYHRERGAYHALACDLQEELRFLGEAFVVTLIRRRQVKPGDFTSGPSAPCLLEVDARRRFIAAFEERLLDGVTPAGGDESMPYLEVMARQVRAIRAFVVGETEAYTPFRLHA